MQQRFEPSGISLRPRFFLREVETRAVGIRKALRAIASEGQVSENPGSMDDAVALAELVEQIARRGQTLPAAEALDLAEHLELLLEDLLVRVDDLLAS